MARPPAFLCPRCEGTLVAERFAHIIITYEVDPHTGAVARFGGAYGEPDLTDEIIISCPACRWRDDTSDIPVPFEINTTAMNDSAWLTMQEVTDG